jgi:hypothetical protein
MQRPALFSRQILQSNQRQQQARESDSDSVGCKTPLPVILLTAHFAESILPRSDALVDAPSGISRRPQTRRAVARVLLTQKVLRVLTKSYQHHPQLLRFAATTNPPAVLASYLRAAHAEAMQRGYYFNAQKIGRRQAREKIPEARSQLLYEWRHLKRKLEQRDP